MQRNVIGPNAIVSIRARFPIQKERKFTCCGLGPRISAIVTSHNNALFAVERGEPIGIALVPVRFANPRRTISQKDILSHDIRIIGRHAVPGIAVHKRHRAALWTNYFYAGNFIMGIVKIEILPLMAAGHIDKITQIRRGKISQPIRHFDLYGQNR